MLRPILCLTAFAVTASLFAAMPGNPGKAGGDKGAKHRAAQAELFRGLIPTIEFEVAADEIKALQDDPRYRIEWRFERT